MAPRVVLVTGSSSGLGAAIAEVFASRGDALVVNSARSVGPGRALARRLPSATYVQGDISKADDARAIVEHAVETFGALDVLINNAGTTQVIAHRDLDAVTPEVWGRILGTNLVGTFNMIQQAAPSLRSGGAGQVINISSVAGSRPAGSSVPYSVSKAGINQLTRLLAKALAPAIRVNALAPGFVDTPLTAGRDEERARLTALTPMGSLGKPSEIARSCYQLSLMERVTGEIVHVDGGERLAL